MKKINLCLTALLLSILAPAIVRAQSYTSYTTEVKDVVISNNKDNSGTMSMSFGGVKIEFGNESVATAKKTTEIKATETQNNISIYCSPTSMYIGINNFISPNYSAYPEGEKHFLDLASKSVSFAYMPLGIKLEMGKNNNVKFDIGIGLKWDNYTFNDLTLRKGDDGMVHPVAIDPDYEKSKLTTFSFHVPVTLKQKIGPVRIEAGAYCDFITNSFTKYKNPKHKESGGYGIAPVQPGLTFAVGYKDGFALYGNMGLAPFFRNGEGPRTKTYTIGIKLF